MSSLACSNISSGYIPSSIVNAFHDIPHVDIDFKATSSQFDTTLSYFEAVIIWGAVPVLVCVCLLILMTVYHICVCCCCCCGKEKKPRPKAISCGCAFLIVLLVLFMLGLIGAGLYAEFSVNQNMVDVIQLGNKVDNNFEEVATEINTYNSTEVSVSLRVLDEGLENGGENIQTLMVVNNDISEAIDSIAVPLDSLDISATISDVDYYEEIRHWVVVGYFILIAVILIIVVIVSLCLTSTGTVIMLIIVGVVTVSVWLVLGGTLSASVVMSDICHDPDETVRSFFNDTNERGIIDYFISCEMECSPFTEDIDNIGNFTKTAIKLLSNVNSSANTTELKMAVRVVEDNLNIASVAANNVVNLVTCIKSQGIHEYYKSSLDSACNKGFLFVIILLCILICLAVCLIVLMCCQSCFAGIIASTLDEDLDDEFSSYDVPRASWTQRRSSYTEPYSNNETVGNAGSEEYRLTGLNRNAATIEPPKYTNRPTSGEYDHFDT